MTNKHTFYNFQLEFWNVSIFYKKLAIFEKKIIFFSWQLWRYHDENDITSIRFQLRYEKYWRKITNLESSIYHSTQEWLSNTFFRSEIPIFDRKRKFRNEILSQNSEKISSFLLYCLIYSRKFPKIRMKTKWPAAILLLFSNQTFFKCQNIQRYCIQHHAWVVLPVENRKKLIISL